MNNTKKTFDAGLAYHKYKQSHRSFILAAIVAFVMSSYFVVGYLAGDLLFWSWDIAQWMNGLVGLGVCAVMTRYQFILYGQGNIAGGRKATIVAVSVAVGFSLLSELGQGMERDHIRMETKSLQSPTYKALVGSIGSGGAAHPYSGQLADAEMKLARCQTNVANGIWGDCVESTARLNAIQNQISRWYQQQQNQNIALADRAKRMEKDESNYHPLVGVIRDALGISGAWGSFVLSFLLIGMFEYAFHYLGRRTAELAQVLEDNGYDITRQYRKSPLSLGSQQQADAEATGNTSPAPFRLRFGSSPAPADDHSLSEYFDDIYPLVRDQVRDGDIKPTVRPVTDAVTTIIRKNAHHWGINAVENTKPARQKLAGGILEQLEQDGVITTNPHGGDGKAKYVLTNRVGIRLK